MIVYLTVGKTITPIREINNTQVTYWKFGSDCAYIGGGLMPGTPLKIVEVNKVPGNMWVRVELPYSYPPKYLKIAGEEFANNFKLV